MSDTVVISLIGSAATVLVSLVNAALSIMNHDRGVRNERSLTVLKEQTNGMQDKLLQVTGEAEYAKGVKSETDKGK